MRPQINTSLTKINGNFEVAVRLILDILFTKSIEWKHESEWRALRSLTKDSKTNTFVDGHALHLFQFPKSIIKRIIFGCRMSEKDRIEIASILKHKYYNVAIEEVILDKYNYKLNIQKIS